QVARQSDQKVRPATNDLMAVEEGRAIVAKEIECFICGGDHYMRHCANRDEVTTIKKEKKIYYKDGKRKEASKSKSGHKRGRPSSSSSRKGKRSHSKGYESCRSSQRRGTGRTSRGNSPHPKRGNGYRLFNDEADEDNDEE